MKNWAWGLSLITLTIIIHAIGIALMTLSLQRVRIRLERAAARFHHLLAVFIALIGAVGLLLALLHGIEAAAWATAYWWLSAAPSVEEAMLYSIDSITTRGSSGIMLQEYWRMMGALEAADGMLLFGISTAFVFSVMQACASVFVSQRVR